MANPAYDGKNPQIEIHAYGINSGDAVVVDAYVTLNETDFYTVVADARRDPGDPSDDEIGIKLAVGRALRQLGREILKDGQEGVRTQDRRRRAQEAAVARSRETRELRAKAAKKAAKRAPVKKAAKKATKAVAKST